MKSELTSVVNRLAQVGCSGLPHLSNNKGSNLGGRVVLALRSDPSVAVRVRNDLEGNVIQVLLNFSILELSTDQTEQYKAIEVRITEPDTQYPAEEAQLTA